MRLLIAGLAAVAALAIAAPSFAQQEDPAAAPAPAPTAKPKPGTMAYCQKLKSASQRSACMKKLHAQATPKATTTGKKAKKPATPAATAKPPEMGQLTPPPAAAPAPAPTGGAVAVPPLPQKTI
jgi:hypothetical protein